MPPYAPTAGELAIVFTMSDSPSSRPVVGVDPPTRAELDDVKLQLLGAIDAARGAEAERAALQARVLELEHQHHMLKVERDELRRVLELGWRRLPTMAGSLPGRIRRRLQRTTDG